MVRTPGAAGGLQRLFSDAGKLVLRHGSLSEEAGKPGTHSTLVLIGALVSSSALVASLAVRGIANLVPLLVVCREAHIVPWLASIGLSTAAGAVVCNVMFASASRLLVEWSTPARGSGLPVIKCLLKGTYGIDDDEAAILNWRVALAKGLGLSLALAAGLPYGTEGPFIHISACIASHIRSVAIPVLPATWRASRILRRPIDVLIILAMVAVGSGATFSAPVGGAILGIEFIMPHMLDTSSWFLCCWAAVLGSLFASLEVALVPGQPLLSERFLSWRISRQDEDKLSHVVFLGHCVCLGIVCGLLGGFFVRSQETVVKALRALRRRCVGVLQSRPLQQVRLLSNSSTTPKVLSVERVSTAHLSADLLLVAVAVGLNTLLAVNVPLFSSSSSKIFEELLHPGAMDKALASAGLDGLPMQGGLLLVLCLRFILTALCIRLPLPSGCVMPCLVIGSLLGHWWGSQMMMEHAEVWMAVIAASSFTAAVCRTFSIVVILLELLTVRTLVLPMATCTLFAIIVAEHISASIFDSLAVLAGLPYRPNLDNGFNFLQPVDLVMQPATAPSVLSLRRFLSFDELAAFVHGIKTRRKALPHVIGIHEETALGKILLSTIRMTCLMKLAQTRETTTLASMVDAGVIDLLQEGAAHEALASPITIAPTTMLTEAYTQAQLTEGENPVMFVTDNGLLAGVLTTSMILDAVECEELKSDTCTSAQS